MERFSLNIPRPCKGVPNDGSLFRASHVHTMVCKVSANQPPVVKIRVLGGDNSHIVSSIPRKRDPIDHLPGSGATERYSMVIKNIPGREPASRAQTHVVPTRKPSLCKHINRWEVKLTTSWSCAPCRHQRKKWGSVKVCVPVRIEIRLICRVLPR